MIVEGLTGLVSWLVGQIFSGLESSAIPTDMIAPLLNIMKFGVWVLGADLYMIVITVIFGWLFFKLTSGIVLFIYRLIPLT